MRYRTRVIASFLAALLMLGFTGITGAAGGKLANNEDLGLHFADDLGTDEAVRTIELTPDAKKLDWLDRVGGVVLEQQTIALPARAKQLSLSRKKDDFGKFSITIDGKQFQINVPDWQLKPLVRVANSKSTVMATIIDEPRTTKEKALPKRSTYFIQVHPDLLDTVLGMHLVLADMTFVEGDSVKHVRRISDAIDLEILKVKAVPQEQLAAPILGLLIALNNENFSSYVLWDNLEQYTLLQNGPPHFSGIPTLRLWHLDGLKERVWNEQFNVNVKRTGEEIQTLCPRVFDSLHQSGRLLALFRHVKNNDAPNWKLFVDAVEQIKQIPDFETPRAWVRK